MNGLQLRPLQPLRFSAGPQRPAVQPNLPPTEAEESLLSGVMGGMQWAGEALGKGGAAVRGVVSGLSGGDWGGGLKNLIPFSDTMGITDPAKRIYTDDLLTRFGWESPTGDSGADWAEWFARGAVSLTGDVVSDPVTWANPGILGMTAAGAKTAAATKGIVTASKTADKALSGAQKATTAFKAGKLGDKMLARNPAAMAEQVRRGERALFSGYVPFAKEHFGVNLMPAEWVAKTIETAAYSKISPLRYWRGLFSTSAAKNATTFNAATHRLNDMITAERAVAESSAQNLGVALGQLDNFLGTEFEQLVVHARKAGDTTDFTDFLRNIHERFGRGASTGTFRQELDDLFKLPATSPMEEMDRSARLAEKMHQYADMLWDTKEYAASHARKNGIPLGNLVDVIEHDPRRAIHAKGIMRPEKHRTEAFQFVPNGTLTINRMATDGHAAGFKYVPKDKALRDAFEAGTLKTPPPISEMVPVKMSKKEWAQTLREQLGPTAATEKSLSKLRQEYVHQKHIKDGLDRFWTDKTPVSMDDAGNILFDDAGVPLAGMVRKTTNEAGETAYLTHQTEAARWMPGKIKDQPPLQMLLDELDTFSEDVWTNGIFANSLLSDVMDYTHSLIAQSATLHTSKQFLKQKGVLSLGDDAAAWPMLTEAWSKSNLNPNGLKQFVRETDEFQSLIKGGMEAEEAVDDLLGRMKIDPYAADAFRAYRKVSTPKNQHALVELADNTMKFYKSMLYSIWPASRFRDVVSDMFRELQAGEVGVRNFARGKSMAYQFVKSSGKTEGRGGKGYVAEFFGLTHKKLLTDQAELGIPSSFRGTPTGGFFEYSHVKPFKGLLADPKSGLNPLASPGLSKMFGRDESKLNIFQEIGAKVGNWTQNVSNAGYYTGLRLEGKSPAQALALVKELTDYSRKSKFERDVMARLFPWWGWTRLNVPFQMKMMLQKPGGMGGRTLAGYASFAGRNEEKGVYTPRFLQERMPLPLGNNPAAQSFMLNSMLPFNDLSDFVFDRKTGMPDLGRTAEKFAAKLHPLALWPIEGPAGRQMFSGRDVADLESTTEGLTRPFTKNGIRIPWLDRMLQYSPVSRVAGTALGIVDPRKTATEKLSNLLGTGRVATYDTEAWKLRDLRDAYGRALEEDPDIRTWKSYYLPGYKEERMEPEAVEKAKGKIKRRGQLIKQLKKRRVAREQRAK